MMMMMMMMMWCGGCLYGLLCRAVTAHVPYQYMDINTSHCHPHHHINTPSPTHPPTHPIHRLHIPPTDITTIQDTLLHACNTTLNNNTGGTWRGPLYVFAITLLTHLPKQGPRVLSACHSVLVHATTPTNTTNTNTSTTNNNTGGPLKRGPSSGPPSPAITAAAAVVVGQVCAENVKEMDEAARGALVSSLLHVLRCAGMCGCFNGMEWMVVLLSEYLYVCVCVRVHVCMCACVYVCVYIYAKCVGIEENTTLLLTYICLTHMFD